MEILKSSLKQVPEAERVKGRLYGVSDDLKGELTTTSIFNYGNTSKSDAHWNFWFELPESMLPVREVMPDEFELKQGEWEKLYEGDWCALLTTQTYRRIKTLPQLSIPAGTKADQLEYLRGIIATMEGGGV